MNNNCNGLKESPRKITCQYCGKDAKMVKGLEIYPHRSDLKHKNFWYCKPCGAYVGCHRINPNRQEDGTRPLGELSNQELRRAKIMAHLAFDNLWKSGKMSRKAAYRWLSEKTGIDRASCHIGSFTIENCKKVVEVCFVDPK